MRSKLDFLDCEESHDEEFVCSNRMSCFSHTLQLVVNIILYPLSGGPLSEVP